MCLIVGVVALAFFRTSKDSTKLIVFVLFFLGASGFGYTVLKQQSPVPNLESPVPSLESPVASLESPVANLEATRQFCIGRWKLEKVVDGIKVVSFVDYSEDGSFSNRLEFVRGDGEVESEQISGSWVFTGLAKDQFRIKLNYKKGGQVEGTCRILNHDRIHYLEEDCDAVRVPR